MHPAKKPLILVAHWGERTLTGSINLNISPLNIKPNLGKERETFSWGDHPHMWGPLPVHCTIWPSQSGYSKAGPYNHTHYYTHILIHCPTPPTFPTKQFPASSGLSTELVPPLQYIIQLLPHVETQVLRYSEPVKTHNLCFLLICHFQLPTF